MPKVARNIIVAFDGTSNEFDHTVGPDCGLVSVKTYVVPEYQRCKAVCCSENGQPRLSDGVLPARIGTYTDPSIRGKLQQWCAKTTDLASAWYLGAHVMRAYEFLMDNYLPGDSIVLFGFSRGAYTARALAGMLDSVGLLSRGNREQVPFAYRIYKSQPELAAKFTETFCTRVDIQLLGLWDTVASMGLFVPRKLPLTSNTTVKHFRHAISLDENRTRFNVTLWKPRKEVTGREVGEHKTSGPRRVREMWFAGGHSDVGGGNDMDGVPSSLANISLRWMLHEIQDLKIGILFDNRNLDHYSIPTDCVERVPGRQPRARIATDGTAIDFDDSTTETEIRKTIPSWEEADNRDAAAEMHIALKPWSFWWLFQFPVWTGKKGSGFYWGKRVFPEDHIRRGCTHIHPTVLKHMELQKPYEPNALLPTHWRAHIDGQPDMFD